VNQFGQKSSGEPPKGHKRGGGGQEGRKPEPTSREGYTSQSTKKFSFFRWEEKLYSIKRVRNRTNLTNEEEKEERDFLRLSRNGKGTEKKNKRAEDLRGEAKVCAVR